MTLGVDQRLEAGDNLSLNAREEGSTVLSTTSLTFGLLAETRNQRFSADAGIKLRAGEVPSTSDIDTGIVEPSFSFDYLRDGANASFNVNGSYRESDISFRPSIGEFADEDGVIVLPEDFEDLEGSGTRRNYSLQTNLQLNQNGPLSFIFDAGVSGTTYDQQSPTLNDIFRYTAGARANLRFSEVTTGFVAYNFRHFESEDIQNTERDTNAIEVGVSQTISRRASVEAAIGYSETEEQVFGFNNTTSGVTGRISFDYLMPNGTLTASYATTRDQDGARHNVSVGRALSLPNGELSASIGATSENGSDPSLIGSLSYMHELPTGSIRFGFNRNVTVDNNDSERVTTTADMAYKYNINQISNIGFDVSFGFSEGNSTSNETQRTDVSTSYNRDLTEDWRLSTGVSYSVRDQQNTGKSDSTSVFVSLNREFKFFP